MFGTNRVMPSLTIAILSRQCLVWSGLQQVLESSTTIPIVVQPYQGRTSDGGSTETRADVYILDLETYHNAIDRIRQIRESSPTSKIVVLGGIDDWQRLHEVVAYGIDGVILTIQPPEVVLAVIEALYASIPRQAQVDDGGSVGVDLKHRPQQSVNQTGQPPAGRDVLTVREQAVVQLVQRGLSNKEIASQLCISDITVRHHLTNIFDKVGVPNRKKLMVRPHQFRFTAV